ncbi:MAG: efflux RND transporter periplasmic adaptor subunit [Ardenticatenaceae bacterium]|nr:efflux RND transporter periplasmic adaptor subunit [Ardenticatenaceae bacterium]
MHPNPRRLLPVVLLTVAASGGFWWWQNGQAVAAATPTRLSASGTIEATEIVIAAEAAGRVKAVAAAEGEAVQAGTTLVTFDDTLLQAQRRQAEAAVAAAQGAHGAAQAALAAARAQLDQVRAGARTEEIKAQEEAVAAAQSRVATAAAQVEQARAGLSAAQAQRDQAAARLAQVEQGARDEVRESALVQVKQAEAAVKLAQADYDKIKWRNDVGATPQALALERATLNLQAAQANYDALVKGATPPELDAARAAVTQATAAVTQATAAVSQAEAGLETARAGLGAEQARLELLRAGARPQQLEAAEAQVEAAAAQVKAAAAQVKAAQAALGVVDAQIAKLTVAAPADSIVLNRSIEPGEVALPGGTLLVLGDLGHLSLTVYVPEDKYGSIRLNEQAAVTVDSFPGQTFAATVQRIADRAEFTPRNVQTIAGRKTTVFAIKLAIANPAGKLKAGMPADVTFGD